MSKKENTYLKEKLHTIAELIKKLNEEIHKISKLLN